MLSGKRALITGSTRGIGKAMAKSLANEGCEVIITGKSIQSTDKLPGSVYSVAEEIGELAHPMPLNLRNEMEIKGVVEEVKKLGGLDILVNNASAMWWKPVELTNLKHFDLMHDVNVRATYGLTRECLPLLLENGGHVITHSPPLENKNLNWLSNRVAYSSSKLGMTLVSLGFSQEYKGKGVAFNTIWPSTPIESHALINNNLGNPKMWRKPKIIADCIVEMVQENPETFNGFSLIDSEYLATKGKTDLKEYRCVEDFEPPPLEMIIKNL